MAQEIGRFLGEGGATLELALPLPEVYQEQVARGRLRRVDADGNPWLPPTGGGDQGAVPDAATGDAPAAGLADGVATGTKPPVSAGKPAWVAWAVACGANPDEAEADTKNGLVEKYGAK
jgi:hypothetical protein